MPLLRKTGVRSPWMPAPLQGALDRGQQALVIAAIVPSVLLGGNTQFIGQAARPEDPQWPARPALVIAQPVPIPGASVWAPQPARLPNSDPLHAPLVQATPPDATLVQPSAIPIGRLSRPEDTAWPARPAVVQVGAQPQPGSSVWQPTPPKSANTDPLHALMVQQDAPDPTLQQPSTLLIGRLARDEDTTRPARPAVVQVGAQPQPSALALPVGIVHDAPVIPPDRLSPSTILIGAQPQPTAAALFIGAVKLAPTDKLTLTTLIAGQQPVPAAPVIQTYAPRDQVAAPPDHVWPVVPIAGQQPQPTGPTLSIGTVKQAPDRVAPTALVFGQQPVPQGMALATRAGLPTPTDRVAPTAVQVGAQPQPLASVWWGRVPLFSVAASAFAPGSIHGPSATGALESPNTTGTLRSPNTTGTISG